MRRRVILVAITSLVAACGGGSGTDATPPASPTVDVSTSAPPRPATVPPPTPVTSPVSLPPGLDGALDENLPPAELDPVSLIPRGTDVEGTWILQDPEAVVIAYVTPGGDPFRSDRGTLVWRRVDDTPPWRAVAWFPTSSDSGVLGVDGLAADVTGDGRQDVLFTAFTGGSGACARWLVIDVQAAAVVFARDVCDGRIDPSVEPVGLSIDRAVYRPGDPHCCPSGFSTTVLTYDGRGPWSVASRDVRPA